jgi:hypothetical protein
MAGKTGWVEKRRHERIVATVKISYRIIAPQDAKEMLSQDSYRSTTADQLPGLSQVSPLYEAVTQDVSVGGLSVLSEQPILQGTVVEVGLTLPNYKTVLKFLAEIVHVESVTEMGSSLQRSGVRTLAINKGDVTRMEEYLIEKARQK